LSTRQFPENDASGNPEKRFPLFRVDELQSGDGTDSRPRSSCRGSKAVARTVRDTSERKRTEAELTESFAVFKTVMYSQDTLVYVADMKTCFLTSAAGRFGVILQEKSAAIHFR